MRALRMFRGGSADEGARKAPATRMYVVANKLPENQSNAELPSAFRVNSTASSRTTGSNMRLAAPMIAVMANNAPVSFIFTAQMRLNHPAPMMGLISLMVKASRCVRTRSKRGDVTPAATMPVSKSTAPNSPEVVAE